MSNLRFLSETNISSAVSSITLTDLFTDDFDIYKLVITAQAVSTANGANLRFVNSAGTVVTNSSYDRAMYIGRANSTASQVANENGDKLQFFGGVYDPEGGNMIYYIFNPTNTSAHTLVMSEGSSADGGNGRVYQQKGVLKELSSITGVNFSFNDDDVDVASIKCYGVRVD